MAEPGTAVWFALGTTELRLAAVLAAAGAVLGWWVLAPLGARALEGAGAPRATPLRGTRGIPARAVARRGGRFACAAIAATLWAGAGLSRGADPLLPALLVACAASAVLIVTDVTEHRLPNAIILPAGAATMVLVLCGALANGTPLLVLHSAIGAAALFAFFLALALASPSSMGMGDVKLAGLLGMVLGLTGWTGWLLGLVFMFVIGGVVALISIALRRAGPRSQIPFGPSMIVATALIVVLAWPD